MKVINTRDPVTQVHVNYLVSMLEYATIVSADCWDVLIALKPGQRGGWRHVTSRQSFVLTAAATGQLTWCPWAAAARCGRPEVLLLYLLKQLCADVYCYGRRLVMLQESRRTSSRVLSTALASSLRCGSSCCWRRTWWHGAPSTVARCRAKRVRPTVTADSCCTSSVHISSHCCSRRRCRHRTW